MVTQLALSHARAARQLSRITTGLRCELIKRAGSLEGTVPLTALTTCQNGYKSGERRSEIRKVPSYTQVLDQRNITPHRCRCCHLYSSSCLMPSRQSTSS